MELLEASKAKYSAKVDGVAPSDHPSTMPRSSVLATSDTGPASALPVPFGGLGVDLTRGVHLPAAASLPSRATTTESPPRALHSEDSFQQVNGSYQRTFSSPMPGTRNFALAVAHGHAAGVRPWRRGRRRFRVYSTL